MFDKASPKFDVKKQLRVSVLIRVKSFNGFGFLHYRMFSTKNYHVYKF